MDKLYNWEQMRLIFITGISPVMGIITPTAGFVYALIVMFSFNIWAGMRADGIGICRCRNFRFRKFKNALAELFLYLAIIESIYTIMSNCGDSEAALIIVKSLTYVFLYVYAQNSFRNLVIAYPSNVALRIIYHLVRLEFTRMLPEHWKPIVERFKNRENDTKDNTNI